MAKEGMFGCDDHAEAHAFHEHPDGMHHKHADHLEEHERGAGHPAHHSKNKMRSQLNPDHGPHGIMHHKK